MALTLTAATVTTSAFSAMPLEVHAESNGYNDAYAKRFLNLVNGLRTNSSSAWMRNKKNDKVYVKNLKGNCSGD